LRSTAIAGRLGYSVSQIISDRKTIDIALHGNSCGSGTDPSAPIAYNQSMTSPLASTNSHGIRVVADRAPLRQDVKTAFAKGSREATAGIDSLTKPRNHRGTTATAKRS
jgi:hypothetical protein